MQNQSINMLDNVDTRSLFTDNKYLKLKFRFHTFLCVFLQQLGHMSVCTHLSPQPSRLWNPYHEDHAPQW